MHVCSLPQVSTNGLISFGTSYSAYTARMFPIEVPVVAPYWSDIVTANGSVLYRIADVATLQTISNFISSREGVVFSGSFALVVRWDRVCSISDQFCNQVSLTTS